ncbi:MAG: 2-C-methyl-D-erythritol 4-phosphate cytidylyltransferase [Chlamydiota bacterium]
MLFMYLQKKVTAVLLMAGSGLRAGFSTPKQFLTIHGKALYEHTLDALKRSPLIDEIALICPKDWYSYVKKTTPNHPIFIGGSTRQESSRIAAESVQTDLILIHDGVRPFVSPSILQNNIEMAYKKQAVNTCIPSSDTISLKKTEEEIGEIPTRSQFFLGQTPQTFSHKLLLKAHREALLTSKKEATDDCSLILRLGLPVAVVKGSTRNMKITTPFDVEIAAHLLAKKKSSPLPCTSLQKKTYILIGGTGGIGQEISRLLNKEGAKTISVSRSSTTHSLDLERPLEIRKTLERIYEEVGEVDGLINTAGYLTINPLKSLATDQIEQLININLKGVIYACQSARIKKGGHIINFASSSFSRGRSGYGIYSACKAAIVNFTEALADEEPHLRINTLVPPRCSTKMRFTNFPGEDPKTLLPPKKVAELTIALLKDSHITGSVIEVARP